MRKIEFTKAVPTRQNILIFEAFLLGFYGKHDVGHVLVSQDTKSIVIMVPEATEGEFIDKLRNDIAVEDAAKHIRHFVQK